ncbi:uncharacterized protein LOC135619488 isoform X6 [Musa acuminata AAA Group]|uniref:uncharacterized protein LOC135619488 isoform X6 n=1 Tax=Musa acuminata AAA Group TaxID=214697 RepID=UPI0031DA5BEE
MAATSSSASYSSFGDVSVKSTGPCIKFLCSYGGKILPRYPDGKLRYVGGYTRVVAVGRSISFSGEAEGAVRVGRHGEPPVPASDRGPRHPGLCHLRRRPSRSRRRVRRREPRPAFPSQDPSLPPPPPPKPVPPSLRTDCVSHVFVHTGWDLRLHGHGSPRASNCVVRHVSRLLPLSFGEEGRTHQD